MSSEISWVPTTAMSAASLSYRAVLGGHEGHDGSALWVIRARRNADLVPGKLAVKHAAAYIPYGGHEIAVQEFEVLCAPPGHIQWQHSSDGQVPPRAIPGGHDAGNRETYYVGRALHNNSLTPGKVHPSHRCCYICFSGKEVSVKSYEVLCQK